MKEKTHFAARHSRLLLIAILTVTLLVSSELNRRGRDSAVFTSLPVIPSTADEAVAVYVADRNTAHDRDMAALLALTDNEAVDPQTRQAAALQMTEMAANREYQQALETALASTALAPCAAVVSGGSVTIITGKTDISPQDSALVLTLAAAHAGAKPSDVRILTVP